MTSSSSRVDLLMLNLVNRCDAPVCVHATDLNLPWMMEKAQADWFWVSELVQFENKHV